MHRFTAERAIGHYEKDSRTIMRKPRQIFLVDDDQVNNYINLALLNEVAIAENHSKRFQTSLRYKEYYCLPEAAMPLISYPSVPGSLLAFFCGER